MTVEQQQKLNEVHAAIVGNPSLGTKGIIKRIDELEAYKEQDEKFKNKVAGGLAVGTPIFVAFWHWITKHF